MAQSTHAINTTLDRASAMNRVIWAVLAILLVPHAAYQAYLAFGPGGWTHTNGFVWGALFQYPIDMLIDVTVWGTFPDLVLMGTFALLWSLMDLPAETRWGPKTWVYILLFPIVPALAFHLYLVWVNPRNRIVTAFDANGRIVRAADRVAHKGALTVFTLTLITASLFQLYIMCHPAWGWAGIGTFGQVWDKYLALSTTTPVLWRVFVNFFALMFLMLCYCLAGISRERGFNLRTLSFLAIFFVVPSVGINLYVLFSNPENPIRSWNWRGSEIGIGVPKAKIR